MNRIMVLICASTTVGMFIGDLIVAILGTREPTWINVLCSDFALALAWIWLWEIHRDKSND